MKPYTLESLVVVLVIPAVLLCSEQTLGNPLFSRQASPAAKSNLALIRSSDDGSRFVREYSEE